MAFCSCGTRISEPGHFVIRDLASGQGNRGAGLLDRFGNMDRSPSGRRIRGRHGQQFKRHRREIIAIRSMANHP